MRQKFCLHKELVSSDYRQFSLVIGSMKIFQISPKFRFPPIIASFFVPATNSDNVEVGTIPNGNCFCDCPEMPQTGSTVSKLKSSRRLVNSNGSLNT